MDINRSENYLLRNLKDSIEIYEQLLSLMKLLREQTPLEDKEPHGEADQAYQFLRKMLRRQELVVQALQKKVYHHVLNVPHTEQDYFKNIN